MGWQRRAASLASSIHLTACTLKQATFLTGPHSSHRWIWHTCRYPDLQEAKTELEKEWLADLNAALGDNLEAHLHDPKGPSLPISIHFASKAPTAGP